MTILFNNYKRIDGEIKKHNRDPLERRPTNAIIIFIPCVTESIGPCDLAKINTPVSDILG